MLKQRGRVVTTDAEIDAAIARSNPEHRLVAAGYDAASDAVTVRFSEGITASFPRQSLEGLQNATAAQLASVEIEGPMGLFWPALDVAHDVPGLLAGTFGTRRWLAENGRRGGLAKTSVKARAAKINGAKGGRPKRLITNERDSTAIDLSKRLDKELLSESDVANVDN